MQFIIDRLREPSTYAGLSTLAVSFGISQDKYNAVASVLAAIFGALAVFVGEKK